MGGYTHVLTTACQNILFNFGKRGVSLVQTGDLWRRVNRLGTLVQGFVVEVKFQYSG